MDVLEAIRNRRSLRVFSADSVSDEIMDQLLDAGRWAPSGLNNQPWRFRVLRGQDKDSLAPYTKYGSIIAGGAAAIVVCLDTANSYHREKDLMGVGACIQNILLAAHSLGLGGCWLGEILKNKDEISRVMRFPKEVELCAVIAVGYPRQRQGSGKRKTVSELMV
jgi:nitroreductase